MFVVVNPTAKLSFIFVKVFSFCIGNCAIAANSLFSRRIFLSCAFNLALSAGVISPLFTPWRIRTFSEGNEVAGFAGVICADDV